MPDPVIPLTADDPHGGPDGRTRAELDFSVNSNPFGPAPELLEWLACAPIHTYPDPTYLQEKRLTAAHHRADASQVCFGNGAADLIHRLSRCYLDETHRVLIATPTFGEYARAARLCGATVHHCSPYQQEAPDVAPVLESIRRYAPTLVWLCHPNNPTGHAWRLGDIQKLAETCQEHDALLILDLAYLDFLKHPTHHLPHSAVQLYSLTKSFRMPGVRLGYTLAPAKVVSVLEQSAPPWQVSTHAQSAVGWALSQTGQDFLRRTLPELQEVRRDFQTKLRTLGLQVRGTSTNYFLAEVGHAAIFKQAALRAGFRVRDGSSFGLPTIVRLAAQQPQENQVFLDWLESTWLLKYGQTYG